MTRKKYILVVIFVIVIILIAIFFGIFVGGTRRKPTSVNKSSQIPKNILFNNQTYQIEDTSSSPTSSEEVMQGQIMRITQPDNPALETFVVKNAIDGSMRELAAFNEKDITFENMQTLNWSPTDRFAYVYIDYPNRRDVIFLKTDGTFTNGQFYLHSTGLYPDMNVLSAKWLDEATLELQTTDIKTQQPFTYIVDFDDDSGIISQCPGGPSTCSVAGN